MMRILDIFFAFRTTDEPLILDFQGSFNFIVNRDRADSMVMELSSNDVESGSGMACVLI